MVARFPLGFLGIWVRTMKRSRMRSNLERVGVSIYRGDPREKQRRFAELLLPSGALLASWKTLRASLMCMTALAMIDYLETGRSAHQEAQCEHVTAITLCINSQNLPDHQYKYLPSLDESKRSTETRPRF